MGVYYTIGRQKNTSLPPTLYFEKRLIVLIILMAGTTQIPSITLSDSQWQSIVSAWMKSINVDAIFANSTVTFNGTAQSIQDAVNNYNSYVAKYSTNLNQPLASVQGVELAIMNRLNNFSALTSSTSPSVTTPIGGNLPTMDILTEWWFWLLIAFVLGFVVVMLWKKDHKK